MKIEIDRDTVQQAVTWADNHGEQVSFAGGMPSVYGMDEWSRPMRQALAAANSVKFDGTRTEPAQQAPVVWMPRTWAERYVSGVGAVTCSLSQMAGWVPLYTAPQPAPQQKPDSLHLAAMDLARKQAQRIAELESEIAGLESGASHMSIIIDELRSLLVEVDDVFGKDGYGFPFEDGDSALIDRIRSRIESIAEPAPQLAARVPLAGDRIAELEAEVERFRQHALNEREARKALEQQLAARVPMTEDELWSLWNSQGDDAMDKTAAIAFARATEAAHGITKGGK